MASLAEIAVADIGEYIDLLEVKRQLMEDNIVSKYQGIVSENLELKK